MQNLNMLHKFCFKFELLFWLIHIQTLLASGSKASLQTDFQSNLFPVVNDRENDVTDALYHIAQVLQNNQQHSSLYERISALEASLSLSVEKNNLLESRIKNLEEQIPDMNAKIETAASLSAKTEALEANTNDIMDGFEEKLSTIVGEILRWKNLVLKSKEIGGVTSSKRLDDVIVETPREVELSKSTKLHHKNKVMSQKRSKDLTLSDSSVASDQKILFGEIYEICPPAASSGLPPNDDGCLFTEEGSLVNWTMADRLCQLEGGSLASFHEVESVDFLKGKNIKFWISTAPDEKFLQDKEKILQENYKYFGDGPTSSQVPVSNVQYIEAENSDNIKSEHVNIQRLKILAKDSLKNSSGVVDIRNLPYFEGKSEEISERNVYLSNVQSDESGGAPSIAILASDDDVDEEMSYADKKSLEGSGSLSIPQDAVSFKEFLRLETGDIEKNKDPDGGDIAAIRPMMDNRPMSDSSSDPLSVSLFSLLKGETSSNFIRKDAKREEKVNKKCPLLLCTEDSNDCLVLKRPCMELNAFWCKKKG